MTAKDHSKRNKGPRETRPAAKKPAVRRYVEPRPIRFETLIAALVLVAAIVALYPGHVFQDKIFFSGDNKAAASFAAAADRAMEEEEVYPVWNPYLFAGMPSFVSLSYLPYVYPPSAVLGLLSKYLFFPKYIWLFFHTFLVGFGTYLLLRDRKVWFFPAIAAGVLMMWMPNLVAVGAYGHGSQACAVGYIPFALLFWDRLWRGKGILVNGSALIIVLGFSMLRGHLQVSYYTYGLVGMHLLFFGGWRIVDGFKGRMPEQSSLPDWLFGKLTGGGSRYTARAAVVEFVSLAAVLAVAVGASFLMSAVLYIPAHDYVQYSIRGASETGGLDYGYATSWSLHPAEMLTFVLPFSFGFGKDLYIGFMPFTDYPNYVGFVVLAGAIAAVAMARSRFVWFLVFVVGVSTLISFGRFFPVLYDPLFKLLPFFNKFRVPVMVLIVQQFALVLMFAIGLRALLSADPERGKRNVVMGLAIAFLVFMVVILSQGFWPGGFAESVAGRVRGASSPQEQMMVARVVGNFLFKDLVRFSIMLAILFAALFLYYTKRIPRIALCAAVFLLAVMDFYLVDRHILHPEQFRKHEGLRIIHDRDVRDQYKKADGLIEALLRDDQPFRVFPMDSPQQPFSALYSSNRFMVFGISSIGGYHPAKLSVYQDFFDGFRRGLGAGNFQVLDMLNVRYFVTGAELPVHPRLRPVWNGTNYQGEPRFVYENVGSFPRAWLVDAYRVAEEKEALELVALGTVDLYREAILMKEPVVTPVPAGDSDSAYVVVEKLGFNEVKVRTVSPTPSILVLSEVYYPDWKVEVDGRAAEVLRADFILRGVALDGGEHEVVFRYDSSLIKKSAYASASTLGIVTLVLVAGLIFSSRGRKSGRTGSSSNV
jgi:hypothetical protein